MKQQALGRNLSMDVIRCTALFGVNSVHFFLHTNFYKVYITGIGMYLATLIRSASMTCVPLFLLLSGYLMKGKQPNKQYYTKLIRIVCIYFLANACCYMYFYGEYGTLFRFLLNTLNFSIPSYAWYINMYFGLFLLIPYLNILYKGISHERGHRNLILTLLILTAFPKILNCFLYLPDIGWQINRSTVTGQILIPDWWCDLYPITYYFLGSYLKDHPLKLSKRANVLLLLIAVIGNGTFNYLISYNFDFIKGIWQDWGSMLNVVQSVLLFNLLSSLEFHQLSDGCTHILTRISELSLGAFLVSLIFDDIIYSHLQHYQPIATQQLLWYPFTTAVVFISSVCLSWFLDTLYSLSAKGLRFLYRKKQKI